MALTHSTPGGFAGEIVKRIYTKEQLSNMTLSGTAKRREVEQFPEDLFLAIVGNFFSFFFF